MRVRGLLGKRLGDLRDRLRRKGRSGSAAIEFAMLAPVLFLFLFGIIETGVLFFAGASLQNATDDTARLIRTGQMSGNLTASQIKIAICNEVSALISSTSCNANLQVDLRSYNSFSSVSYGGVTKPDGSIDPTKMTVESTTSCEVVLMRSFYPWTVMTPLLSPLLSNMPGGDVLLASAAAFRTEPYQAGATC